MTPTSALLSIALALTLPIAPAIAGSFAGTSAGASSAGGSNTTGSSTGDDKLVLEAREDAAMFVATDGQVRGARLEAALQSLRRHQADARGASDLRLALDILAR